MTVNNNIREKILNQPNYWIEGVNGFLYEAIVSYMEKNNMKRKDLAKHLGISAGRVSQILNDGEINFSIDKIIQIALKVERFPDFKFEEKQAYLNRELEQTKRKGMVLTYNFGAFSNLSEKKQIIGRGKIVSINQHTEVNKTYKIG